MGEFDNRESREDIFSKAVRAGRRTYFFDVKSTRANDLFLTITESKKRFGEEGTKPYFEKHKIFLYQEDFEKFLEGLNDTLQYIRSNSKPREASSEKEESPGEGSRFSDVDFDDLGDK